MNLRCPDCNARLDPARLACRNSHRFQYDQGVLVLLAEDFGETLHRFTRRLSEIRGAEGRRITDPTIYEDLPFAVALDGDPEWRLRRYDTTVIDALLGTGRPVRALDIGAWNGWLSHWLAARGHDVTAVDYFIDEFDGLAARRFYGTTWRAIQMDLTRLDVLDETYDVVIVNRCLHFFTNPIRYVAAAQRKVREGGMLILTGLQFFRHPRARARRVEALRQHYQERYGFELFIRPTRGYLDGEDRQALVSAGVELRSYKALALANLRSVLARGRPFHAWGLWTSPGDGRNRVRSLHSASV